MNDKINRQILQAFLDGEIAPEDFLSEVSGQTTYFFREEGGIYTDETTGKQYTQAEYEAFCARIQARKKDDIIWLEQRTYENLPNETDTEANPGT